MAITTGTVAIIVACIIASIKIHEGPRSSLNKIKVGLRVIVQAAENFKIETGHYPASLDEMSTAAMDKAGRTWSLDDVNDPWGRPYTYRLIGGNPHAACMSRDGLPGGTGKDQDYEWPEPQGAK